MNRRTVRRCLGAFALYALSAAAFAQSGTSFKSTCTSVGNSPPEQLAGREGQSISIGTYVCTAEGGPMQGATMTGTSVWHFSSGAAKGVSGTGVARAPGGLAVYEHTGATMKFLMNGNQVVGFEGDGKGTWRVASGSASALEGKTYTFTFKSTAPGRFDVDTKID
jgi:hypothetical protein